MGYSVFVFVGSWLSPRKIGYALCSDFWCSCGKLATSLKSQLTH